MQLHHRKIRTQQVIYQEELKIIRLLNTLIVNSELERYEEQLSAKLEEAKEAKVCCLELCKMYLVGG
jgi:hypothetical protein